MGKFGVEDVFLFVSDIEVSEVISRRERKAFIKFPWQIYANDPAWLPPLIIDRKGFLDRKRHPFYRHAEAASCLQSRSRASRLLRRIMPSDDPHINPLHQPH